MHQETSSKFFKAHPPAFKKIISYIHNMGYEVIFVGGVVRDFFLKRKSFLSFDGELRKKQEKYSWPDAKKLLIKQFGFKEFKFYVLKVEFDDFELELVPPRIEIFSSQLLGHSDFKARIDFRMPMKKSWARRDFTINAIGISSWDKKIFDVFEGLKDLKNKKLNPCGQDFDKDPVRYLRAIRFANCLNFSYSKSLLSIMEKMDLSGMTYSWFVKEFKKSKSYFVFLKDFIGCGGKKTPTEIASGLSLIRRYLNGLIKKTNTLSCHEQLFDFCLDKRIPTNVKKNFLIFIQEKPFILLVEYCESFRGITQKDISSLVKKRLEKSISCKAFKRLKKFDKLRKKIEHHLLILSSKRWYFLLRRNMFSESELDVFEKKWNKRSVKKIKNFSAIDKEGIKRDDYILFKKLSRIL